MLVHPQATPGSRRACNNGEATALTAPSRANAAAPSSPRAALAPNICTGLHTPPHPALAAFGLGLPPPPPLPLDSSRSTPPSQLPPVRGFPPVLQLRREAWQGVRTLRYDDVLRAPRSRHEPPRAPRRAPLRMPHTGCAAARAAAASATARNPARACAPTPACARARHARPPAPAQRATRNALAYAYALLLL